MKRLISLILCLCMLSMGAVAFAADNKMTETATDDTDFGEGASIDITAVATNKSEDAENTVYSVEIVWGDMQWAYGFSGKTTVARWNPVTHTYDYYKKDSDTGETTDNKLDSTAQDWYLKNEATALTNTGAEEIELTTQNAVMVFNHSNKPVDVAISKTDEDDKPDTITVNNFTASKGVTTANDDGKYELARGEKKVVYSATNSTCVGGTIKVTGTPDESDLDEETPITLAKVSVTISKHTAAVVEEGN